MSQTLPTPPETQPGVGTRNAPGPRSLSPLGSAPAIARDTRRFALDMWQRYGDIVRFRVMLWPAFALYHPDHLKYVLQDNHRNFDKQFPMMKTFRPLFGNGLFTNDGESWLHQRRLMQPSFHHKRLAGFGAIMTEATLAMLEQRWQGHGSQPLDIPLEMMRLTQRIVGLALFNVDLTDEVDTVGRTFIMMLPLLSKYTFVPFPPLWVPTPRNRRLQAGLETLNSVVYGLIDERKRASDPGIEGGDLLSMLLAARDEETGKGMSDQQVRDEVMTLLLAGHETTSMALTWTWYLLSQHPEVEQRLHAELEAVLAGQVPTVEHLVKLPYTRMVIQEALRLYPPAFGFTRHTIADDEIGGYHVPADSILFLSPYYTHRHPAFWEEPERFDPERFTPERSVGRPRFAYAPFGGGPRQCIGNAFALMEAQLVLATVAQRYRLRLLPGHPVEPQVVITVRPRYGLPMTLQAR